MSHSNGLATIEPSSIRTIQPTQATAAIIEQVVIKGDLSQLTPAERVSYYNETCRSIGVNPLTRPFQYIELDKKLVLYATRDCADQLRAIHGVSVEIVSRETIDGLHMVTAKATLPNGRVDTATGIVPLGKAGGQWKKNENGKSFFEKDGTFIELGPEERANALMKAETKAKRRVALSICGLGWLDETEIDTISSARRVAVSVETGEILDAPASTLPNPNKLARLHAVGAERGLDHDALHRLTRFKLPQIASMAQLTEAMANDLALELETASDADVRFWAIDWDQEIADAEQRGMNGLNDIAAAMRSNQITSRSHPWIAAAWQAAK
jgi:hypothetical protein